MKKYFILLAFLFKGIISFSQVPLLTEEFSYTGLLNANGWTAHSGIGTLPINTTTGLTYTDYPGSGTGNAALVTNNGEDINLGFTSTNSGSIYVSFLVNAPSTHTNSSTGEYVFHLGTSSGSNPGTFYARVAVIDDGANYELSISKFTTAINTNLDLVDGTTTLVVIKYSFISGTSNDLIDFFVFPDGATYPLTEPVSPTISTSAGADPASLASVCLRQSVTSNDVIIDGIHVATSWASALPISLTQFSGTAQATSILLSFSTESERDNDFFAIERSVDGRSFVEIGQVKGAGTSRDIQHYTFTDEHPVAGKNYYRLRQVDFDGKYAYSSVVSVTFAQAGDITIAPSPATDRVLIQLDAPATEDGTWQVFDAAGRLVQSGVWMAESDAHTIQVGTLPEGMYAFRLAVGQTTVVKQFRKQ